MNKKSFKGVIFLLAIILLISTCCYIFIIPLIKNNKSYSLTSCLNDQITENMDVYDIAKLYRDNACVAVQVEGNNGIYRYSSHGSGVCIASKGYETNLNYVANKGSYIATNYHVIEWVYDENYNNVTVDIITEDESIYTNCEVVWASKDLDVAIVYCDDVNLNYVRMSDRVIECEDENKLDIEPIFTIGSPLSLQNLNDFTIGYVRSNNSMTEYTGFYKYYYQSGFGFSNSWIGTENEEEIPNNTNYYSLIYIDNVYEDVVSMSVEISPGNSGGGVFDENGNLVGLATLSTSVSSTNGNQINGMVAVYPIMEVLDRVIYNNENTETKSIYDIETLGLIGIDSEEAYIIKTIKTQQENDEDYGSIIQTIFEFSNYYYLDGQYYSVDDYKSAFNFEDNGYYVISNTSDILNLGYITSGCIITKGTINSEINTETYNIENRNDFIYLLLNIDDGESVTFEYTKDGIKSSITVQF